MDNAEIQKQLVRIAEEMGFRTDWKEPASDAEIAEAEEAFGVAFPETYRRILKMHNGSQDFGLMDLEESLETAEDFVDLSDGDPEDPAMQINLEEDKPGLLKDGFYRKGWVPFFSYGTGALDLIDCDPGPKGVHGQIIRSDPDGVEGLRFDSLEEWLEEFDGS